jgi:hypothetical protein
MVLDREAGMQRNSETVGRAVFCCLPGLRRDCGEEGRGKWLRGAVMDALSTKHTEFAQGFYVGVWKRWEIGEG